MELLELAKKLDRSASEVNGRVIFAYGGTPASLVAMSGGMIVLYKGSQRVNQFNNDPASLCLPLTEANLKKMFDEVPPAPTPAPAPKSEK